MQKERESDRQTDRHTDGQKDREINRYTRKRKREGGRETDRQIENVDIAFQCNTCITCFPINNLTILVIVLMAVFKRQKYIYKFAWLSITVFNRQAFSHWRLLQIISSSFKASFKARRSLHIYRRTRSITS